VSPIACVDGRLEIATSPTLTVMTHTTASSRHICSRSAQRSSHAAFVWSIACASLACAARDLDERDLGNTSPPLIVSDDPAVPRERLPVVRGDGSIDPFVEGHWVGQAENLFAPSGPGGARPAYVFPSGSTEFTLDISLADPTIPSGQIVFGSGPVPEPERGIPYPPGFSPHDAFTIGSADLQLPPQEGRVYELNESILRLAGDQGDGAGALALSYAANAAYIDWCALQQPRPTGDGRFDCLSLGDPDDSTPTCSTLDENGNDARYDCNLAALCGARNVCECTEDACFPAGGASAHIWFIRDDDALLGTFSGAGFDHGNASRLVPLGSVRFQRVNP
jgi:hypothetical protein